MVRTHFLSTFCGVTLLWLMAGSAAGAEIQLNPQLYQALADAASPDTIPPGTKITLQNWQKYKRFLDVGTQALFSGDYLWKIGPGPEYTIVVGPTHHFVMPKQYREDTEKYHGQAKLRKVDTGGYVIDGYVAGLPFPAPSGDLAAIKVMYDTWLSFGPFVDYYYDSVLQIDRYLNVNQGMSDVTQYRLMHDSDPPYPIDQPYAAGFYQVSRYFVYTPEQNKYLSEVTMQRADPAAVQDAYVYLPSLRRVLRLSSAARCSPSLGTDWVEDDSGAGMFFQLSNFTSQLLGEKKVLWLVDSNYPKPSIDTDSYVIKGTAPSWPKPEVGQWELRDVYIMDITPLPVVGPSYCYRHKVFYTDKETFVNLGYDAYDNTLKFWKQDRVYGRPVKLPSGEVTLFRSVNVERILDMQNSHATFSLAQTVAIDKDVPHGLSDGQVWAFPSGLDRIMQ
jgi:Protein of unknown function (DUF1329)